MSVILSNPPQPFAAGIIFPPIVPMQKLRPREVELIVQGHTLVCVSALLSWAVTFSAEDRAILPALPVPGAWGGPSGSSCGPWGEWVSREGGQAC